MGGDGGSIPKRTDLVKEPRKRRYKDKEMDRTAKWTCCYISENKLKQPIMGCALGRLYNKESVIEMLLLKSQNEQTNHIKKLKDLKELKVFDNSNYNATKSELDDDDNYPFICPLSGVTMNGKHKFGFFWTCGCVLAEKSVRTMNLGNCPNCSNDAQIQDFILINSTEENTEKLIYEHEERLKKIGNFKKQNKGKNYDKIQDELFIKKSLEVHQIKPLTPVIPNKLISTPHLVNSNENSTKSLDSKHSSTYKSLFTSSEEYQNLQKIKKPSFWATSFSYHL